MEEPYLIPLRTWCKLNGVGLTTAYKFLNSGELKAVKVGKKTFIRREEAARWAGSLPVYKDDKKASCESKAS